MKNTGAMMVKRDPERAKVLLYPEFRVEVGNSGTLVGACHR